MKDYTNETPVFSESIRVTETSDPAHADNINMAPIQIFQNTLCNHDSIEKIKKGMGYQEEYNADNVYQTGDYCQYQGILYKCVQNTTGEWDPACWKQTNAMNEISDINIPEFDDYSDEGAEVPDAREAIANIRSKKGFTGIMSNIKAALMGLVTLGEVRGMLVNNGLCSEAGKFFLDAAYGKNLQDQLTKLNSDLQFTVSQDIFSNEIVLENIYDISDVAVNVPRKQGFDNFILYSYYFSNSNGYDGCGSVNMYAYSPNISKHTMSFAVKSLQAKELHIKIGFKVLYFKLNKV